MKAILGKRILGMFAACAVLLTSCGGLKSPDFESVLKGIEITSPTTPATAPIGGTLKLTANGLFTTPPGSNTDSVRKAITGVQWASNSTSIATVDASTGLVSGLSCGTARILARAQGFEQAIDVTVGGDVLRAINVAPTSFTIHVGESKDFTATGVYRNCSGVQNTSRTAITQPIAWSVTDPSLADVTPSGSSVSVKGKAITTESGTRVQARVTNEEGQPIVGEATLVITPALLKDLVITGVGVSPPYRVPVGGSLTFEVKGIYSDSNTPRSIPADPSPVSWVSSNTARATFATDVSNAQNTLTARSKDADPANNAFNITVSAPDGEGGTVRATQPLQITVSDAVLQSITDIVAASGVSPLRVALNGSESLIARGTFTDGTVQNLGDDVVTWSVAPGITPAGAATITTFNSTANPPVVGGVLTGTVIGNVNVTATANSAAGTKVITRAASVTDPICVAQYVEPATAVGNVSGGPCLTGCSVNDAGAIISPSASDFAFMTISPTAAAATLRLNVSGDSVTAAPGQKAGFIVAYNDGDFSPGDDMMISVNGAPPVAVEPTPLDPTSDGLQRSLVRVPVTGTFTSISAVVTNPAVVGLNGIPNPTGLLSILAAGGSVDVRFYAACSTAQAPVQ